MYKKKYSLLLMMLMSLFLISCGKEEEPAGGEGLSFQTPEEIRVETRPHVTEQNAYYEKDLYIDADVEVGDLAGISRVTLTVDEEMIQKFVDDMIRSKYPEVQETVSEESGDRQWDHAEGERTLATCMMAENGFFSYLDVQRNLNCPYLDGEHILEYGYVTEQLPPGLEITAEEAGEEASRFLEAYSCFSFRPWNILAGDRPSAYARSGCYSIDLQAVYKGIPILVKGGTRISATVFIAGDGIFEVQGVFPLKEDKTEPIEKLISLDSVLKKFQTEFAAFSEGDAIRVNRIALEYIPEQTGADSYTLHPVWTFACAESRVETYDGQEQEIVAKYDYVYSAESGDFYSIYYG